MTSIAFRSGIKLQAIQCPFTFSLWYVYLM